MGGDRSFKDYVASRFYNELYDAVSGYLEQNYSDLDVSSQVVRTIDSAELSDIEVKHVFIDDLPGMEIAFDVLLEAVFEISETDRHNDRYDEKTQWFKVSCTGDLSQDLDDFAISATEEYNYRGKQDNPMSDSLVPIIYKEQLEAVARAFLEKYYEESLFEPMAINPIVLAERMRLSVQLKHITPDFSTFGQVFFADGETEYYDKTSSSFQKIQVKSGTIFVDPDAYFLRNLGSVNNTIIHECVHWDKHRKAFELERLYNENATQIKCQVVGGIKDNKDRTATDWMEWQANALAPRIQMPLAMFKTKAFELIKQYRRELGKDELIDVMEPVIDTLATFFCVSRIAAKIRMIDAGYEEAIGTFTYIDGRYVKPHRFKKGTLERNQTYSIGAEDAAIQGLTNPTLISLTKDGSYLYVDAHFVLNYPKYLTQDIFGQTILTDYARTHMEECCLVFDLSVRSSVREKYHSECFLNRDETSTISFDIVYGKGYQFASPEKKVKLLADVLTENARIYSSLPNDLTACLKIVREWRGVTFQELSDRTFLNERTIRRIVNGEEKGSLNSLILICLALHLPPEISFHIIDKSPFSLTYSNQDHIWYDFALKYKYSLTMDEIRAFLQEHGAEAL